MYHAPLLSLFYSVQMPPFKSRKSLALFVTPILMQFQFSPSFPAYRNEMTHQVAEYAVGVAALSSKYKHITSSLSIFVLEHSKDDNDSQCNYYVHGHLLLSCVSPPLHKHRFSLVVLLAANFRSHIELFFRSSTSQIHSRPSHTAETIFRLMI